MDKLLIKGGLVVTVDPQDRVFRNGSVYVEDNVIKEVGPATEVGDKQGAEVIDASEQMEDEVGSLEVGKKADVVIFDPEKRKPLDADHLHMRTDISPYAGWEVQGWPRHVLQRGRFVVQDGAFVGQPGNGEFIPRQRPTLA
jgi:dihydroorotase-like cyclic amidohydrolase